MMCGSVETRYSLTTLVAMLPMLLLSVCLSTVTAMPASINLRSSGNQPHASTQVEHQMHLADGFLRDFMFSQADDDRDGKLSEDEIAWFYEHILHYAHVTAAFFGNRFIAIADTDGDSLLDRDELLLMLVLMNASDWTRR